MILLNSKTGRIIEVSDKQAALLLNFENFAIVEVIPDLLEEEVVIKKTRKSKK
jgi:hypothetical protein